MWNMYLLFLILFWQESPFCWCRNLTCNDKKKICCFLPWHRQPLKKNPPISCIHYKRDLYEVQWYIKRLSFRSYCSFFCYHSNLFQKFVHLILTLHMKFSCKQLSGYICICIGLVFMEMLATLKIPGLKCIFKRVYHPIKVYIRMTSNLLDLLRTIS